MTQTASRAGLPPANREPKPTTSLRLIRLIRLNRSALLLGTALQSAFMLALPTGQALAQLAPNARPQGGAVSTGSASIGTSATTTSITQSSQTAAINWSSFNVGSAQSVRITAPNSSAVTVNRVATGNPSQIAGQIQDNGVFVLTNPSGVVFSKGAQVTASSVIVTTAGVTDQNVKAGKLAFDQPGNLGATVVNQGRITVKQAGLAALVAPGIANSGVISAPMGKIVLAGAAASTVDLYGDGMMSIDVTKQVTQLPAGPDGKPVTALVTNTGTIAATGGQVLLTARAVDGIVTNLVEAGGRIAADTTPQGKTGRVVINGIGGSLTIEGHVTAAGTAPGTTGGSIELNASNAVNLTPAARINASGSAGGGTITIGASPKRTAIAQATSIAAGARIAANATQTGNGGRVTVLSAQQTTMAGTITATGGKQGGNGGFIEVSGNGGFALTGAIDVTAAMGNAGAILLDPANLIVTNGAAGSGSLDGSLAANGAITAGTSANANGTDTVSNTEIGSLNGGIVLQAGTALSIADNTPVTLKNNASLTLQTSAGPITLGTNSPVTASGTGGVFVTAGSLGSGASISLGSGITTGTGGEIVLQADGNIALRSAPLITGLLGITSTNGALTQDSAGMVNAGTLFSRFGIAGSVSLPGTANAIATLGGFSATGTFALVDSSPLTIVSTAGGGPLTSVTAPSVTLGNGLAAAGILKAGTAGQIALRTGTLTVAQANGGTLSAPAGTVSIAPYHATDSLVLGTVSSAGTLGFSPGTISFNTATVTLGGANGTIASGNIAIVGSAGFGSSVAQLNLLTSGSVTQTAALQVTTLGGTASSVTLNAAANSIGTLAGFAAPNGFALTNTAGLTIAGTIDAHNGPFAINNGTAALTIPGGVTAATAALSAASIAMTGSIGATGLASLVATTGSIGVTGQLNAGTVTGSAATGASIANTGSIGMLGAFTAGTSLLLSQATGLTVAGPVAAGTLASVTAGSLTVSGSIAARSVTLAASAGTLSVTGTVTPSTAATLTATGLLSISGTIAPPAGTTAIALGLNAGTISVTGLLSAGGAGTTTLSAGTIQAAAGTLIAGTLTGSAAIATLTGTANAIATLRSFAASQSVQLFDSIPLDVIGPIGGGSVVALAAPDITLGDTATAATGTLTVAAGGRISLQTDILLSGQTTGTLNAPAGTLEIAPFRTTEAVALGTVSTPGTLGFDPSAFTIAGTVLSLGGNNGTAASTGIVIAGPTVTNLTQFATLDLLTLGTVTQTQSLAAALVAGSAAAVTLVTAGNTLGALGNLTVTNDVSLANAGSLSVAGLLSSGGTVALGTGSALLGIPGTISAAAATLSAGSIAIGGTLAITGDAALLAAAAGITESASATINAGTLTGSAATSASFAGINTIGTANVSSGGSLVIDDSTPLLTSGTISAATLVSINAPTLTIGGTVNAPAVTLGASIGALTLNGTVIAPNGTVALTGAAGIAGTGLILGGGTVSATSSQGAVSLSGPNAIAAVSGSAQTGFTAASTMALTVGSVTAGTAASVIAPTLTVAGTVAAPAVTLAATAGSLSVTGLVAPAASATLTATGLLSVPGTIAPASGAIALALNAGTIAIPGLLSDGGSGTTALNAATITAPGTLIAGTLSGSAAVASLTGISQIGTLADFTAGTLTLNDSVALTIAGTLAIGALVTIADTGSLLVSGAIAPVADPIAIGLTTEAGAPLTVTGKLNDGGGTTSLFALNGGTISAGTGTLIAGSLTGSAAAAILTGSAGSAILTGPANAIGTLAGFTAGTTFQIADTVPLLVSAPVTAGSLASIAAPALTIAAPVTAPDIALTASAGTLALNGAINATGTVALSGSQGIAGTGTIGGGGSLTATSTAGSVDLTNANSFAFLAGSAAALFRFNDTAPLTIGNLTAGTLAPIAVPALTVTGTVAAPSLTLAATGLLSNLGTIAATSAIVLSGSALALGGRISDGGAGTTSLLATTGTIQQTGTLIAGTLTGHATSDASLIGVNQIGTLGSFSAAALRLNDGTGLTLTGPVLTAAATLNVTGSLLVNGAIGASAGDTTLIAAGPVTVTSQALIWSLNGTTDLQAGGGLTQAGGTVDGRNVAISAGSGGITQTGGTIAAVNAIDLTASGTFTESGGLVTANGATTILAGTGLAINAGTVITAGTLRLGSGGTLSMTGGLVAAGSDITIGGTTAGSYTGGGVTQTGGTIASGGTLYASAGGDLLMTATGTRYAATLNVDSTGTTDVNLNGGAVTVTPGGTLVASGGPNPANTVPPGPVPTAQTFAPGNLGRQTMLIGGGAILIDQPEIAGALGLFAHGGTVVGNITETATGGINVGPLEGYARNGGSVSLNQGTNFIGTLLAFSNGLTAAFAADGDFRLNDRESLGIPGNLLIGLANTGSVNTGSLYANGYVIVGGSIGGGSGSSVANIALDTGTLAGNGAILIGGAVTAAGTRGNGGTIALTSALTIQEAGGTLAAYQLTGSTGNGAGASGDVSANLNGAGNLIQTLGSFAVNRGGLGTTANLILVNGRDLSVTGPVTATNLNLTVHAGSLTVTGTGSAIATGNVTLAADNTIAVAGTVAAGTASTVALTAGTITVADTGLIAVASYVPPAGGQVRPGTIRLQADALSVTANGTAAVTAPDGLIEVAPRTPFSVISLDSTVASNPGTLSLSVATLAAINTKGTLATGLPGAGELLLGSLDGSTSQVSAIYVTAPFSLPQIQTLGFLGNGPVTETGNGALSVNAIAGYGTALLLGSGGNAVAHLGVPQQEIANGQTYQTGAAASLGNLTATTGSLRVHDTSGTLEVIGTLTAAAGQTIDLAAPALRIDATALNAGSLSAGTAGAILLAADSLRIESAGTAPIVTAPQGLIAITPYTASHTISIDATPQSTATGLSLATGDLALLSSQALAIGSQDNGATLPNAGIAINAPLTLGTLGLYSTGSITGSTAITVDTLTGRAGVPLNGTAVGAAPADILLTGANAIGTLGAVTASGDIAITNAGNLTQQADSTVWAGDDPTLAVHTGTNHDTATLSLLSGTLTIGGTVQGGSDGALTGNIVLTAPDTVLITPTGSLFAANAGSIGITSSADIDINGAIWGERTTGQLAGTVNLAAGGSINEPGAIGASFLTGSATGHAVLLGGGTPTPNRIATLGPFSAGNDPAGLQLRDGQALTVTGPVTSGQAAALTVAPPNAGANLIISGTISSATGVTLQATGNIEETATGIITAPTLAAQAGMLPTTDGGQAPGTYAAGDVVSTAAIDLGGANQVATLSGATATGDLLFSNARDLTVTGTVLAGVGTAAGTAQIAVAGNLTIAATGLVHAGLDGTATGNVTLAAGSDTVAGSVTVNGAATAANGGTLTIAAGYNTATGAYDSVASLSGIILNGAVAAGTVNLLAAASIQEPLTAASIQAAVLTGRAGGHATLSETTGGALATIASANRIATLGSFTVNAGTADPAGLLLRDGQALTVTGPVTDTAAGIVIAVVPGSGGTYAQADLVLNGAVTAATTADLQATGNVYEQAAGSVTAPVLTSRSGIVPDTEATGGAPIGLGIDVLGGTNQIGTLGNVTATGDFLLNNGQSLLISGTILAGSLGSASGATGAAPGPWGTAATAAGTPFAEIDVPAGNLTIAPGAVVRAGVDSTRAGNVTLRAGSDTAPGSASVLGGLYAANGGTVTISAGLNPSTGTYDSVASGSGILIQGTIAGDQAGPGLAGLVNLDAASSIDEPVAAAQIAAEALTGHAGGHVNLSQTAPGGLGTSGSANQIAALGSFAANAGTDDAQGFRLRDGRSLTVTGPVTDAGASASLGISLSVVPDPAAIYTPGDLLIAGPVSAATTVKLQATGNVIEQAGGAVTARTLITQAGAIPDTEVTGNAPGTDPSLIVTANARDVLGNAADPFANHIGTLANATVTGTLSLHDAQDLLVSGSVLGGAGIALDTQGLLTVTGPLTVASQSGVLALIGGTIALSGAPVLSADTMRIASATSIAIGNGTTLFTGGDVFARPSPGSPPIDPGPDSPGAHLMAGPAGLQQTGVLYVLPYTAPDPVGAVATAHPELAITLTAGTGTISFDPAQGLIAPTASLLLDLGAGNATGHIVAFDLAAFYTSLSGPPTNLRGTLFSADGVPASDSSAAGDAFIAFDGSYGPTLHFQVNGCSFTSVTCLLINTVVGEQPPQGSPLRDLPSAFFQDESDDPDLMIPNVTDRVN